MGNDGIYEDAIRFLDEEGVEHIITAHEGHASSFAAVLNYEGESTQLVSHEHIPFTLQGLPNSEWLYVSELGSDYETLFEELRTHEAKIGFNPGTVQIEEAKDALYTLIKHSELLIVNKLEAHQLLKERGDQEMKRLLASLRALGAKTVIITDGRDGAYGFDGETTWFAPMFPGERIEATGAGDAFSTGLLAALIQNKGLNTALAWGSVNAASVVQYVGGIPGLLTEEKIHAFLKENPDYSVEEY